MTLTQDEKLEEFLGRNISPNEAAGNKYIPPKCHFKFMKFQESDYESWWECDYCGHTESSSAFWKQ